MTKVTFEKVSKTFAGELFLDDLNLEIEDKELMVILGPSRCGKSLILKLIAGIEEPSKGKIYFDEVDVTRLGPKQRDISLVFQSYALYPNKTVFQNLAFPLQNRNVPKKEIEESVARVSQTLGLESQLGKYPGMLSGGERQRVALARAMIRRPKVYLYDSPLTNLDAKLRTTTRTEIKRLQKQLSATTVYATGDQLEALTVGDRITVMNGGKIEQIGKPLDLYQNPANTFVGRFVGSPSMNILSCKASSQGGKLSLSFDEFEITTNIDAREDLPSELLLGVRPEDVKFNDDQENSNLPAKILVIEETRPELTVYFHLGNKDLLALVQPSQRQLLRQGAFVKFDEAKMNFFDPATQKAVWLKSNG